MTYTLESARANLAQLLSDAGQGKDVVIELEGQSAIRLAAVEKLEPAAGPAQPVERVFGLDRGLVEYDDSALDPLSDEELAELGFGFLLEKKLVGEEYPVQRAG